MLPAFSFRNSARGVPAPVGLPGGCLRRGRYGRERLAKSQGLRASRRFHEKGAPSWQYPQYAIPSRRSFFSQDRRPARHPAMSLTRVLLHERAGGCVMGGSLSLVNKKLVWASSLANQPSKQPYVFIAGLSVTILQYAYDPLPCKHGTKASNFVFPDS